MLSLRGVLGELGSSSSRSVCGGVKVNAPQRIIYLYTHIRLLSHIIYQTERIYQKMVWGWEGTTTSHEDNGKLVRKPLLGADWLWMKFYCRLLRERAFPIIRGLAWLYVWVLRIELQWMAGCDRVRRCLVGTQGLNNPFIISPPLRWQYEYSKSSRCLANK